MMVSMRSEKPICAPPGLLRSVPNVAFETVLTGSYTVTLITDCAINTMPWMRGICAKGFHGGPKRRLDRDFKDWSQCNNPRHFKPMLKAVTHVISS